MERDPGRQKIRDLLWERGLNLREAPALWLKSANPDYADYSCLADEVHIVGKVLWTVRRV